MKALAVFLVTAAGWVGSAAASPEVFGSTLNVTFKEEVKVTEPWLKLGDVAELSGLSEKRIAELEELKLSHAPLAGVRRMLGREELSRRLRQAGVKEELRYAETPSAVLITAAVKTVNGEDLVRFGLEFLKARIDFRDAEVEIENPSMPRPVTVPDVETRLKADVSAQRLVGLVPVSIEVWAGEKRMARRLLSYRIHVRMPVIHVTRDLAAGTIVTDGDLNRRVRDLGSVPRDALLKAEQVVGMKLVRPLSEGSLVRARAVSRPVHVKRGSAVTLVAKVGTVEARAAAVAREQGSVGDLVSVMNTESKRTVRARVISPTVVEAIIP